MKPLWITHDAACTPPLVAYINCVAMELHPGVGEYSWALNKAGLPNQYGRSTLFSEVSAVMHATRRKGG